MLPNYQNLIFDLGNVIIDIDYDATYRALAPLFRDEWDYETLKQDIDQVTFAYEQGHLSTELFLNKLLNKMKPDVHARKMIDAWNAMLLDIPAARLDFLKELSASYRVVFLSNTNPLHIEWVDRFLERTHNIPGLREISPDVYYSHELQDRKPNVSIFEKVISQLELDPSQTLFFDDKLENVAASLAAGMHGVHSPAEVEIVDQLKEIL